MLVENNQIVKVRGDKDNPRSLGYCCRKGLSMAHHVHNDDRLAYPLKNVGDHLESISWDKPLKIPKKCWPSRKNMVARPSLYGAGGAGRANACWCWICAF
jgi:predicted molibdopterin-dependent oxidoreductase YjgC